MIWYSGSFHCRVCNYHPLIYIFQIDSIFSLSDEGGRTPSTVPSTTVFNGHMLRFKKSEIKWFQSLYKKCGSTRITFQDSNPKKINSATFMRYELYKRATTINQYKDINRRFDDFKLDFIRRHVIIDDIQARRM